MIYEIDYCDYYKVSYLIEDVENFPEVHAIIDNNNPGKIYVDDKHKPRSALVWNQGIQGFYFIGDDNNDNFLKYINEHIKDKIINELIDKEINWFEISGVNIKWEPRIEELFKERGVKYGYQLVYGLNKNRFTYEAHLINEFDIRKVNKGTFEAEIRNLDFVISELELFWGTIDNFLDNGICYYAIEDNKIVSICYSGFKAGKTQTIGIETLEEYKRRGYAYALASKYIEDCYRQDIIPYWDCSEDNISSKKLAEKLGFERRDQYRCYWFDF